MHLFVLIVVFIAAFPCSAFAQNRNMERYTPPPMLGDTGSHDVAAPSEPRSTNNLDLINLDSITGRSYDAPSAAQENQVQRPAPAKAFKPPLPPRRPSTFQVSQDYLDRIKAPAIAAPSRPRRPAPVINPPALAGDSLNADLRAMDVMDIYEYLNGKTEPDKGFINIPPLRGDALAQPKETKAVQLAFIDNGADLTESHAIQIDGALLPSLKARNARVIIDAPTPQNADKREQRLALSRAIAVRNYLELNGIARSQIDINQIRRDTPLSGNNAISVRLSK